MQLDPERVRAVARLARLTLTPEEETTFARQLTEILDYVDRLRSADVEGVEPLVHAVEQANVFGEDEPAPPLPVADALSGAPDRQDDRFRVPPILQEG